MASMWNLNDFTAQDPKRGELLRTAPNWNDTVADVRRALAHALATSIVRFGMDESGRDKRDLRGIFQFPLGRPLFDVFFNAQSGYRAQFRIGKNHGLKKNANLIRELRDELDLVGDTSIVVHRLDATFNFVDSHAGKISDVSRTLDPSLSKIWVCEKLIGASGGIEDLFVSRTGPKLLFADSDCWSSLYPEGADGWLDVKGAFSGDAGPYQLKSPEDRAACLEERGTA
jgi:hypothetical protein